MNKKKLTPAEILLVEDSPSDVLMTRQALENAKLLNNLHVVEDGVEAMEYLRNKGRFCSISICLKNQGGKCLPRSRPTPG
jgi:CheY-like chemotaxis protein